MKILIFTFVLSLFEAKADPIKVAVIDSGADLKSTWPDAGRYGLRKPKFCPTGHKDFTSTFKLTILSLLHSDSIGHGTHVSGLIAKYAGDSDYCIISYKYYTPNASGLQNSMRSNRALKAAIRDGVDVINYSGGGLDKNDEECSLVKKALDRGITFIAAAGNDGLNVEETPYYPAMCDNRVIMVFSVDQDGRTAKNSNYSMIRSDKYQEVGDDVFSLMPEDSFGRMTGTSQATAIVTGKIVKRMSDERAAKKVKK